MAESLYFPEEDLLNEISSLKRDDLQKWLNNQKEYDRDAILAILNNPIDFLIIDLYKHDKKLRQIMELRKKIESGENKLFPIVSPLALNELMKWNAEVIFKQVSSEAIGAKNVQRLGEKEAGDKLKTLLKRWIELSNEEKHEQNCDYSKEGLRRLYPDLFLNPSFANAHGLRGLIEVDIKNFDYLTKQMCWSEASIYSYLQLGATDIMHILFAKHLGCDYIASKDGDFKRAGEFIKKNTGIEVLHGYNKILEVI
jgi:hypothetical protein